MSNNVKNYFQQPGPDGDNRLIVDGKSSFGPGSLALSGATVINEGGAPQMTFGVVNGDDDDAPRATLYMANEGFDTAGGQSGNTIYGCFAGNSIDTESDSAFIGLGAGQDAVSGERNTSIGNASLRRNTIGDRNVCVGYNSGQGIDTGSDNIIIGATTTGSSSNNNSIYIGNGVQNVPRDDICNIGDCLFLNLEGDVQACAIGGSIFGTFTSGAALELLRDDMALLVNRLSSDGNLLGTEDGMIWYNETANQFRGYINGAIYSFDVTVVPEDEQ